MRHTHKVTIRRGPTRFPGIGSEADQMGIRRETLYRYLTGKWPMPDKTRQRYEAIKAKSRRRSAA
jgi:hypothetical protein